MRISPEQQLLLKQHLRKILKYRETYAEFYDHIITAVEAENKEAVFDDVVIEVIKKDFGGVKGMRSIEDNYKRSVFKELKRKYLNCAIDNFRFPGLLITAALGVLIYFMVKQPWFTLDVFLFNILVIRIIPGIISGLTSIGSPRIYGAPRQSIKSDFFKWQNFFAVIIFFIAFSLTTSGNFATGPSWFQKMIPGVPTMTILTVLMALHSLTYYRVYRDDIKTNLQQSKQ
jgi:hypothetical protein